ncbi:MAG TPA: hypothetical protein VEL07_07335 [Planctomycetota bacterium]|nr:hypothetical protein [Planctomycetota bacterium]
MASARRGGVLPLTLGVVLIVGVMLALSSERVIGVRAQQLASGERQKALYAAEATAALAELNLLQELISAGTPDQFPHVLYANWGTDALGGCVVRWRLDHLRIAPPDGTWTVQPETGVMPLPTDAGYRRNREFWNFRIATEGFALSRHDNPYLDDFDPSRTPFLPVGDARNQTAPWNDPRERTARVQVVRDVIVRTEPLCTWAVFTAGVSDLGDCLLWAPAGQTLAIAGRVHSNASIRFGTGGPGSVDIASAAAPTQVSAAREIVGPATATVAINGYPLTAANDSTGANPAWMTGSAFRNEVRDEDKGAARILTVDTHIVRPNDADGRGRAHATGRHAFEFDKEIGDGVALYDHDGDDATDDFTIYPGPASLPLHYQSDPNTYAGAPRANVSVVVPPGPAMPVFATGMPVFAFQPDPPVVGQPAHVDVWPNDEVPVAFGSSGMAGWPSVLANMATPGYGLAFAQKRRHAGLASSSGLAIHERGLRSGTETARPLPSDANFLTTYAQYLIDRYQVRLCGRDITTSFFRFRTTAAENPGDDLSLLCATEDEFHDARQAQALFASGFLASAADRDAHRVNALTLRWKNIREFLMTTSGASTLPDTTPFTPLIDDPGFKGVIYATRAPLIGVGPARRDPVRPFGYHPVYNPCPKASDLFESGIPDLPTTPRMVAHGATGPAFDLPFCGKAIRLAQAEAIGYGKLGPPPDTDTWPGGLMLMTPNQCYLWGTINVVDAPDAGGTMVRPPCAVLADGVTALSDDWVDDVAHLSPTPAGGIGSAAEVVQNVALCVGAVPLPPPGGTDIVGVVRLLEDWSGITFRLSGSLAVLGRQRYSEAQLGEGAHFAWPTFVFAYDPLLQRARSRHWLFPITISLAKSIGTIQSLH